MKANFFTVFLFASIAACTESSNSSMEAFIPGTYKSSIKKEIDSLTKVEGSAEITITKTAKAGSESYTVKRLIKVVRHHDHITDPETQKNTTFTGFYDEDKKVLTTESGMVLSFDTQKKELIIDGIPYKKIE